MLHIHFHCFTNVNIFRRYAVRYHFSTFMAYRYLHSFEFGCWWCLCSHLHLPQLPRKSFHLMPFRFCCCVWKPSAIAYRKFSPFHVGWTFFPFYRDSRPSCVSLSNFSLPMCWLCQLHRFSIRLILLLSWHLYSSFTLDCFYSVGSSTKK